MVAANKHQTFACVDALERPTVTLMPINVLSMPTPHSTAMAYIQFNLLKPFLK
jgi:hypothetical protein